MSGLNDRVGEDHRHRRQVFVAIGVTGLQAIAAVYFLLDAMAEQGGAPGLVEGLVAVALFAGAVFSLVSVTRLLGEAERHRRALAIARGALGEMIAARFADWNLSHSEADVALFALKGCSIAEIARLRGAASGTVRSQLSQVYGKAGVSGQPALMALFLDELVETGQAPGDGPG